ncbi:Uncharacterized protein dnm_058440 [Desulfonema magnum]|uniref:Uncharacterized protein n=1 Tax=Desulfonema magnum TaxID=45655 RepID=A0A975GQE2_9BACT|nr:Uncharacterized protein dnm_058440 [Desulfonema magnum]
MSDLIWSCIGFKKKIVRSAKLAVWQKRPVSALRKDCQTESLALRTNRHFSDYNGFRGGPSEPRRDGIFAAFIMQARPGPAGAAYLQHDLLLLQMPPRSFGGDLQTCCKHTALTGLGRLSPKSVIISIFQRQTVIPPDRLRRAD